MNDLPENQGNGSRKYAKNMLGVFAQFAPFRETLPNFSNDF